MSEVLEERELYNNIISLGKYLNLDLKSIKISSDKYLLKDLEREVKKNSKELTDFEKSYYSKLFEFNLFKKTIRCEICSHDYHKNTDKIEYVYNISPNKYTLNSLYNHLYVQSLKKSEKEVIRELAENKIENIINSNKFLTEKL